MVYAPVRSIISSLKLGDYLSVQAHKPCSISLVALDDMRSINLIVFSHLQNMVSGICTLNLLSSDKLM